MAQTPLSACVITYQEEDRIADCVRSLSFCDEVLVVDSGSTDRTRAASNGAALTLGAESFESRSRRIESTRSAGIGRHPVSRKLRPSRSTRK